MSNIDSKKHLTKYGPYYNYITHVRNINDAQVYNWTKSSSS